MVCNIMYSLSTKRYNGTPLTVEPSQTHRDLINKDYWSSASGPVTKSTLICF
jgi:hypothetical protein